MIKSALAERQQRLHACIALAMLRGSYNDFQQTLMQHHAVSEVL